MNLKRTARGFTLVELLIVIAIIAILAAIAILIVNPIELTKRSRDAARLSDMANLQQAINVAVQEAADPATLLCNGVVNANFYCTGKSTNANATKADGSGWVKVNLGGQQSVSVPALPTDPGNTTTYHYLYCAYAPATGTPTWEINAVLESNQYIDKMTKDGGNDDAKYEVGSKIDVVNATDCPY